MDKRTVGILGGGQLGRMMIESANKLGVRIATLDPGTEVSIEHNFCQHIRLISCLLQQMDLHHLLVSWLTYALKGILIMMRALEN